MGPYSDMGPYTSSPYSAWQTPAAGLPLDAMERFLMQSLPVAAVAHSFHVEALRNPTLRRDPAFQQFSLIELNELHHQIAAFGDLLRLQQGDPTAAESLAYNLAGFLQNRQAARNNQLLNRTFAVTEAPVPGPLLVRPR